MANYDASIRVSTRIDNSEIKEAEKEVDRLSKKLEQLHNKGDKLEALGVDKQSKQWKALKYDVAQVEGALYEAEGALAQLTAANANADMAKGFDKARMSAKTLFSTLLTGQKKSNSELKNMNKMMIRMLVQMLLFRAFTKTIEFVGAGIQNLSQYSDKLNSVLSDMKSESSTLKNNLATAFEPIITTIVPYITQLISWLNTAMNYIAQFWAVLGGKDTYTRAKKQVVDYAKSLKDASGTAKGALASFDEINVLNKDEGNGAAGGEVTGADAFEEVEVDQDKFTWVEWLKDNLDTVLYYVQAIGVGFLAWKLASGFTESLSMLIGIAIAAAGAFMLVTSAVDAWQNGIDWENLKGMLIGVTGLVGGLGIAFGNVGAIIGALIGGIVLLIVGFKDIMENGVNLTNSLAVIAGTFLLVSSVAGAAIGAIVAAVAGLVLAIVADWENFKKDVVEPLWDWLEALLSNTKETIEGIKRIFRGIINFITGVFTGDWKKAWKGIKDIFAGVWQAISGTVKLVVNTIIGIINTMVNGLAGAINAVVRAINSISFTAPNWVPFIGGDTFSPNIPEISTPANIPYLEYGGTVVQETYAKISEGNRREVVLPLEQHTEWADLLADKIGNTGTTVIRFEGSLAELGRILKPVIDTENSRVGRSLAQV